MSAGVAQPVAWALTLFGALAAALPAAAQPVDQYVLALSWSPAFCARADPERNRLQCDPDADRTFIVHGLWPNTRTDKPANCPATTPDPGPDLVDSMLDVTPSRSLLRYQWKKHGRCSGLDAARYLATVRAAAEMVRIPPGLATIRDDLTVAPDVLRDAFQAANPGLPEDGVFVRCRRDELVEVRVCLSPELAFEECRQPPRRCDSRLLDVAAPE